MQIKRITHFRGAGGSGFPTIAFDTSSVPPGLPSARRTTPRAPTRAGGAVDPLPDDAPRFVRDYYAYYKTPRGYHERSGNSNDGWNVTGTISFVNQPLLSMAGEIDNPALLIHGENAHSRYFSEGAFELLRGENKELMVIPGANHCDLYDGGEGNYIPFDKLQQFFEQNLA